VGPRSPVPLLSLTCGEGGLSKKLYLLLSHAPLLDCTYCLSSSDFKSWAFLLTLPLYALHLLAFGLLTASASALGALDALAARLAALLRRREAGAVPPHREQTYALDRSAWRKSGAWIIAGIAGAEYCLLFGAADSLEQSVPKWALHVRCPPLSPSLSLLPLFHTDARLVCTSGHAPCPCCVPASSPRSSWWCTSTPRTCL
jgi:hypothetical protein